uniref:Uncharacterized protein n=1 Tax=Arundo donax TaxID=35708 RepID=A0A0A9EW58_ARUDO
MLASSTPTGTARLEK